MEYTTVSEQKRKSSTFDFDRADKNINYTTNAALCNLAIRFSHGD